MAAIYAREVRTMVKESTTKRTTEALLKRLLYCVDNYTPEEWSTTTKERLQWQYDTAKQVSETLRLTEVMLLYYLRNSGVGNTYRFMKIAKKLFKANQALEEIKSTSGKKRQKGKTKREE